MPRALLSVSDKAGLAGFARGLAELGFEIYSTGGTLRHLREDGLTAHSVSELTHFPEIMDGRVKTLHPGVHGGLLARRDRPDHMDALEEHGLKTIDLLCVNLYPFVATATRADAGFDEVIENIDIGGPAMIRAAAKNFASVVVVVRPSRYDGILAALRAQSVGPDLRQELAAEAYAHTAAYDASVSGWLRGGEFPAEISLSGSLVQSLRYGENPHQRAAFYASPAVGGGLGAARQLQGAELSYNNIQDAGAALALVAEFESPAAAIIKHTNPCGVAIAGTLVEAYRLAHACDTTSAFGGIVALNCELDAATAQQIAAIFVEVIVAPGFAAEAMAVMARRPKVRLLEVKPLTAAWRLPEFRSVPGGFLVQTRDEMPTTRGICTVVSRRQPTEIEWDQLLFAWSVVKHVKSNAIVLAREGVAVGVGAGQMSRVESVRIAVSRAGERAAGTVMASDAFFPFPDGVETGIRAGVTAIIQPGGSMRDRDSIDVADAAGIAMVLTGIRHFRH